ncbi:hypothetical protein [Chryseobacterium sp.]|uniref:hypothetical protein n=1 Tax=Chryseobacterium sp. TaxID=1871047 RepID=UPI0025C45281|nr:hypothetical protein [Chryseobacterium sp.]
MQNKYPQKPGIDFIMKQAFFYWNKTLLFQVMFSIIYFSLFFTIFFYFSERYGIVAQSQEAAEQLKISTDAYLTAVAKMSASEGFQKFSWAILGTSVFLYPLNLGFFQIFRKIDLGEKIEIADLFVGYNGTNFFRYVGYYLFWIIIYSYTFQTIILGVVWVFVTLFVAPLMFFMDKRLFEAISLNFKALKIYFIEILVCVLVAFLFKYLGFLLFFVGGLFTFPFWNAMIYSLYKTVFSEKS